MFDGFDNNGKRWYYAWVHDLVSSTRQSQSTSRVASVVFTRPHPCHLIYRLKRLFQKWSSMVALAQAKPWIVPSSLKFAGFATMPFPMNPQRIPSEGTLLAIWARHSEVHMFFTGQNVASNTRDCSKWILATVPLTCVLVFGGFSQDVRMTLVQVTFDNCH